MEGAHGQLRSGLADGLRRDDADRLADVHGLAGGHVGAVALGAHAGLIAAGEHRADGDLLDAGLDDLLGQAVVDVLVDVAEQLAGLRVEDLLGGDAAADAVLERLDDLAVGDDLRHLHAAHALPAGGEAVLLADHDVLGDVDQAAGEVTRVRGLQRRIGKALSARRGRR